MNPLPWFGLEEYNAWDMRWALEDLFWPAVLLTLLIPLTLKFFWNSLERIQSPAKKALLFGLRVVTLALLTLVVLRPQLELKNVQPLRNAVAVLLDDSKSLGIRTSSGEQTRLDLVRGAVQSDPVFFERLSRDYQVDYFFFSDHLDPVSAGEIGKRYRAHGVQTDFPRVLGELAKRYEGQSLQGVLLFSDGADLAQTGPEPSQEVTELATRFEGPFHTFLAGSNEGFRDLGIETLSVSDFGFIHQPLRLRATLNAFNMGDRNISVVLKEGGRIHASRVVHLQADQQRYEVEFEFTPGLLGKRLYTLSLPLFSGEAVEVNNQSRFQVNVVRDRIRVLHLNGRPSWDSRFLREVLANNPKVDLLSFFILRTLTDDVMATTTELSLIPFPSNLLFSDYLSSFDMVVFQNFKFKPFIDKKYLGNIKNFVKEGGAFLMIGGDLSFQPGGYQRTPVEEILPVRMERNSKWFRTDEFHLALNPSLQHHPILRLEKDPKQNEQAWASLPPLNGLNIGLSATPGSQLLGVLGTGEEASVPVLAAAEFGEGRSMVVTTDTLWNWNFRRVGEGGSGRYYQKFWENVLSWLTRDPETHPIQLESDKERYREEEKVLINITARGRDYNPLQQAEAELVISAVEGGERVRKKLKTDERGETRFEWTPGVEGFYRARVELPGQDPPLDKEIRFSVQSPTAEFNRPLVNAALMKHLAEVSGGGFHELKGGAPFAGIELPNPEYEVKTRSRTFSLWDSWWSYGLILGFLFIEWWARRKSGLS